ncbi:MAG TPA: YsnF/AvaK domain-containing protein [Humisphaera sp.]
MRDHAHAATKAVEPPPLPHPGTTARAAHHATADVAATTAAAADAATLSLRDTGSVTVPVVEERIVVEKRKVASGRVSVHVEPRTERQTVDVPLTKEHIEVERVPVNRYVEAVTPPREEGDVTVIPVFEEVLVVEKRLLLKEEIRLVRRRTVDAERRVVEVRKEEVRVDRDENPTAEPAT